MKISCLFSQLLQGVGEFSMFCLGSITVIHNENSATTRTKDNPTAADKPTLGGKIRLTSQNIRAYYMLNHRKKCTYESYSGNSTE